ncbi:hypothetical protein [Pedococcus sp. 5OH_020]|uniref:hypothetical protein n=1 Tax=Pedococcus sp. 5OH_020 TaxID=2989814 RepID=UPI0022E9BEF5|nr:hypothetical protein [Pedococcus sp. 5OH_020]
MNRLYVWGLAENVKYSLLRGHLGDWLKAEAIPAQWTPRLHGWCVRTERVGDLIARAEHAGYQVRMRGVLPR